MCRVVKNFVLPVFMGVLFAVLILELAFRFIIPTSEQPRTYFDPQEQILRFDMSQPNVVNVNLSLKVDIGSAQQIELAGLS